MWPQSTGITANQGPTSHIRSPTSVLSITSDLEAVQKKKILERGTKVQGDTVVVVSKQQDNEKPSQV